jgi:hypothetical protein
MAIKTFKYFDAGVGFKDQAADNITSEGVIYRNGNSLKLYIQAALRNIVTDTQTQTLTNKTISGAGNTITNVPVTALTAIIDTDLNAVSALDDTIPSAKATKAYVDAQLLTKDAANEIAFTPAGTIAATNVQAAVEEVSGDVETHKGLATGAHAASAISNVPSGSIAATTVQAALNELDTEKAPIASPTFTGTVSGITAAMVGAPAGSGTSTGSNTGDQTNISGNAATVTTNANLTGVVTSIGNATSLGSFTSAQLATALTDETGSGANVFGTSPTITSASLVTPSRLDMKKDTKSNLTTYALTAADGQLVFATDTLETFVVKTGALSAVGGGGGIGNADILSADQADLSALTDYTQTGLEIIESPSPVLHGTKSFRLQHTTSIKSFKKVIAVDRKFRGKNLTVILDVVSSATSGNLNILFYNETSSSNLVASQSIATGSAALTATTANASNQLTGMTVSAFNTLQVGQIITGSAIPVGTTITALNTATLAATMSANATGVSTGIRISALDAKKTFSFDVPNNCLSLSWTISSVVEVYAESYIDDVVVQLTSTALTSTSISQTTFNATDWASYTPAFTGFGTPTAVEFEWRQVGANYEIRGKAILGTTTATEARISLPNSATSAASPIIPSIHKVGVMGVAGSFAGQLGVLIEPSVTYMTFDSQGGGFNGLTKRNGNDLGSSGTGFDLFASVPITGLTSSTTTTTIIPLTTAQLVQQSDSELYLTGATAVGIVTATGYSVSSNIGSDFSVNTSTGVITVLTAGQVTVTANASNNGAVLSAMDIYVNGVTRDAYVTTPATNNVGIESVTQFLANAGDLITIKGTLSTGNLNPVRVRVSKQGSLKQLNPSTDSKITIPTHQLRFEGASARGSTDTAIVKFDTQAITQGDAWDVVNTAANGTVVTMKKAGKLNINSSLNTPSATNISITKNQVSLTGAPSSTESIVLNQSAGAFRAFVSGSTDVVVGDKIRIYSSTPPSSDTFNNFVLSLAETSIPANFSNVLPQWSQSDSSVRLNTANGYGSTNTKIRRFTNTVDNLGSDVTYTDSATLGASVTVNSSGIYTITYSDQFNSTGFLGLTKNTVTPTTTIASCATSEVLAIDTTAAANFTASVSWTGYLVTGDTIRPHTDGSTTGATTNGAQFTISKVGKPNLSSVDVTSFVNLKTTDTQSSFLSQTASFGVATITGGLTSNTNNGVYSYDSATGIYTALKAANISITAAFQASGANSVQPTIIKNTTTVGTNNSLALIGYNTSVSANFQINAGETFKVTNGFNTTSTQTITVLATADNNATASPTQQVSSDTMSFVFKSTAIDPAVDAIGTFNTYTIAATSSAWVIATSAPTQTISSMNVNGIQLFSRAYTANSTAASPTRVDVFIGKGLKSKQVDAYAAVSKATPMSIDWSAYSTNTENGTRIFYNETTGILTLDGGSAFIANTTRFLGQDLATSVYNTGYFVFNASKSPSLVTIPSQQTVAASYWLSANFTASTTTPINFDSMEFDTHGAVTTSPTAWKFTAPSTGYYQISFAGNGNASANILTYKNGTLLKTIGICSNATNGVGSGTVKLVKGDYIDIRSSASTLFSGGTLGTNGTANISIIKSGGY